MMNTKTINIILFLLVSVSTLNAQIPCNGVAVPTQLQNNNAVFREGLFEAFKLPILNKHLSSGNTHPLGIDNIEVGTFFDMLNEIFTKGSGVRIYFGAYSPVTDVTDNAYVLGNENILVPIFVPTVEEKVGTREYHDDVIPYYYIIDPIGNKFKKISDQTAHTWVNNYTNNILSELSNTLPRSHFESDTKRIWYSAATLKIWIDEIKCQFPNLQNKKMSIKWNVFDKDMILVGASNPLAILGQLTILFDIPDANLLFSGKNYSNNDKRKNNASGKLLATYDTGVPCPPAENCDLGTSL